MKQILLTLLCGLMAFGASATLNGDGYYRVQNAKSGRYTYVMDNRGRLDFGSTTAEVDAIELWMGHDRAISDPACVIYVTDLSGNNKDFDFQAQGTGVYHIISHPVSVILRDASAGKYRIFGRDSGLTRYLGDGTKNTTAQRGYLSTTDNSQWNDWYFSPITDSGDEYFGVVPTVKVGNDYYQPFYADFPFKPYSQGMEVYTVNTVDQGMAVLTPVNGIVPRGTPVLIKCSSDQAANNRLSLGGTPVSVQGNKLKGVYFENYAIRIHTNLTPYDPQTMRLLMTNAQGELVFGTSDVENVPRNKAYLPVPAGSPAEFKVVTQAEYDQFVANQKFKLTYMVDGEVYKTAEYKAGATVTPEPAPVREGYTFSGWDAEPATMPAHDVTVSGTFSQNSYDLNYYVDGEKYKSYVLHFGDPIEPEPYPVREGYTFSGWGDVPATMPSRNLDLSGTFSAVTYTVTYMLDGSVFATENVKFGEQIPVKEAPAREGHTFDGWAGMPSDGRMPAYDLTLEGSYRVNYYTLKVYLEDVCYYTASLAFGEKVTFPDPEIPHGSAFGWWEEEIPETMPAHNVTLHGHLDGSGIEGVIADIPGTNVDVYTATGVLVLRNADKTQLDQLLPPGLYIAGGVKIIIK